jgi:tRNA-dihydrouridine synthase B
MSDLFRHGASGRALVGLAPLAGYSDAPFRLLCAWYGADFAFTEMVSADGLVRDGEKTKLLLGRLGGEAPVGVQLFGADPATMARAAAIAAGTSPAWIDINFGCPVRKVIQRNGGVRLMRDLSRMRRIVEAVVRSVDVPVTAKIRSGWSKDEENYLDAGRVCEECGVSAVTLHPRYKTQAFSGGANWDHIAKLAHHLAIPVVANGDVRSVEDFDRIVETTGCRIVAVGRGALGHPWLFKQISDWTAGREPADIDPAETINVIERFVQLEVSWRGERSAVLEARKHYRWFLRGLPGVKHYRSALTRAGASEEVLRILKAMRKESCGTWKRPA